MDRIKDLIAAGKTKEAIQELKKVTAGTSFEEECILLSNQYERIAADKMLNVLDDKEAHVTFNKINRSLLEFIESIEFSNKIEPSPVIQNPAKKLKFLWIGATIIVVLSAVAYFWYASSNKTYHFDFEAENVPIDIIEALDSLKKKDETVKDIAVDINYARVFLLGRNSAMWKGRLPPFLAEKILELYDQNRQVSDVAMGPDSRWVILYDKNSYWVYPNVQDTLMNYLNRYQSGDWEIKQIEFGPYRDEWVMLIGRNGYAYSNIPPLLLDNLQSNSLELKSIAINQDNEWIMLAGKNNFAASENVDKKLKHTLTSLQKKDKELRRVCFLKNGGWIVLTN